MVLIDGVKYACDTCIRGHRVTTCSHSDRPLTMIKPKGRPVSQCPHCREARRNHSMHTKCDCPGPRRQRSHSTASLSNAASLSASGHSCQCSTGKSCACSKLKNAGRAAASAVRRSAATASAASAASAVSSSSGLKNGSPESSPVQMPHYRSTPSEYYIGNNFIPSEIDSVSMPPLYTNPSTSHPNTTTTNTTASPSPPLYPSTEQIFFPRPSSTSDSQIYHSSHPVAHSATTSLWDSVPTADQHPHNEGLYLSSVTSAGSSTTSISTASSSSSISSANHAFDSDIFKQESPTSSLPFDSFSFPFSSSYSSTNSSNNYPVDYYRQPLANPMSQLVDLPALTITTTANSPGVYLNGPTTSNTPTPTPTPTSASFPFTTTTSSNNNNSNSTNIGDDFAFLRPLAASGSDH
ncbi:uncharacterized protein V1516DRAFT_666445 [Lipomyces oligophaga]|uniref:uncharacterized protein n=1 Tax=Lipomyces oligophaga TaxID=45792 RepID=UPI0034CD6BE2